jgi:hypothetical protein
MSDADDLLKMVQETLDAETQKALDEAKETYDAWWLHTEDPSIVICKKCGVLVYQPAQITHHIFHGSLVTAILLAQGKQMVVPEEHLAVLNDQLECAGLRFEDGCLRSTD